jgi:hypothetical protein
VVRECNGTWTCLYIGRPGTDHIMSGVTAAAQVTRVCTMAATAARYWSSVQLYTYPQGPCISGELRLLWGPCMNLLGAQHLPKPLRIHTSAHSLIWPCPGHSSQKYAPDNASALRMQGSFAVNRIRHIGLLLALQYWAWHAGCAEQLQFASQGLSFMHLYCAGGWQLPSGAQFSVRYTFHVLSSAGSPGGVLRT